MRFALPVRRSIQLLAASALLGPSLFAAEHVLLKSGFEVDCVRREVEGDKVRLYFEDAKDSSANFMEVAASSIVRIETVPDVLSTHPAVVPALLSASFPTESKAPTPAEMKEMLASAGRQHHIDADMLASVVQAESGGHVHAVSRTGARGLMQLMPATATQLGVGDSFQADQNINGGTAYLDQLLTRFHDNIALALAAYNAGPAAVDRWHGIPPYRETQAYVTRVIREFNRRKQGGLVASNH